MLISTTIKIISNVFWRDLTNLTEPVICITIHLTAKAFADLETMKIRPKLIFLCLNSTSANGKVFMREVRQRDRLKEIPVIILAALYNHMFFQEARNQAH
jgi:CheY-like chemotaxis protein